MGRPSNAPHGRIANELEDLVTTLARAWSDATELRSLVHAAMSPSNDAARGVVMRIHMRWLRMLTSLSRAPRGPCLPYAWLRPPRGRLLLNLPPGRSWPPAASYSVGCWIRLPGCADGTPSGSAAPFSVFEFASADERSYAAAYIQHDELVVLAGSAAKPAARYPTLPCPAPCPRAHNGHLE